MTERVKIHNLCGRTALGYTTWGCCWKQGKFDEKTSFVLENEAGEKIPVQSRVTAWWPDGTIKWSAHTANAADLGEEGHVIAKEHSNAENHMTAEDRQRKEPEEISGICVEQVFDGWKVSNKYLAFFVPRCGRYLLKQVSAEGKIVTESVDSLLLLETRKVSGYQEERVSRQLDGCITEVSFVEKGTNYIVIRYQGAHQNGAEQKIPFIIYMKLGENDRQLRFFYTFMYDGDEEKDFLKGLGLRFHVPMQGDLYNRHVKFGTDYGYFHEAAALLLGGKRFSWSVYEDQINGVLLDETHEDMEKVAECMDFFPHWDTYEYCQDSADHFGVCKKVKDENCCYLDCLNGNHGKGTAAIGSTSGSVMFAMRDFWEKYPSGYTFKGVTQDICEAVMWLWAPQAESMDFRHYANTGYSQIYYEGYPWKGADPYGIACTSELAVGFCDRMIPKNEELEMFGESVNHPAQYVCSPEYYHACKVFGHWSLISRDSEMMAYLEDQLTAITEFYMKEISQRKWYGMFNFGDVMHKYDTYRHVWRYDMGGFAWDNTELVPGYWIWYMFLRTGREDMFSFGERMTRHTSEVDVYHIGPLKGLGSRHNVRHWGCACKEIRIAMAGHHRFYYYLTGDYRLGEIFDDFAEVETALGYRDPVGTFHDKENMHYSTHARTGPDWSSLCANWMTAWERRQDKQALKKILTGIEDIGKAPLKLLSGPDYEFDPASCHLHYIGERATGGAHLQICMGAAQIWTELSGLLQDADWEQMLTEYGRFYFLNRGLQLEESQGIIGEKTYTLPMLACGIGAYAADRLEEKTLAETVWCFLLKKILDDNSQEGFREVVLSSWGNQEKLLERPGLSTNDAAQWCLNTIMCLELIREALPSDQNAAKKLLEKGTYPIYRQDY